MSKVFKCCRYFETLLQNRYLKIEIDISGSLRHLFPAWLYNVHCSIKTVLFLVMIRACLFPFPHLVQKWRGFWRRLKNFRFLLKINSDIVSLNRTFTLFFITLWLLVSMILVPVMFVWKFCKSLKRKCLKYKLMVQCSLLITLLNIISQWLC